MAKKMVVANVSRRLLGSEPTFIRAGIVIAVVTTSVAVCGGLLMTWADHEAFPNVYRGLWWAIQTVTTVGYGDVVPTTVAGRAIGAVVMLAGIGFLSVLTASIVAAFTETARRQFEEHDPTDTKLDEISARLAALETALKSQPR
jgi:voltage-gated potassium channel